MRLLADENFPKPIIVALASAATMCGGPGPIAPDGKTQSFWTSPNPRPASC